MLFPEYTRRKTHTPLIQELQKAHPGVTQPWYADDYGAGVTFEGIRLHLDDLMVWGTPRGYFPDPTKNVLVMSLRDVLHIKALFRGHEL